jgi:hypothetical protein
MRISPPVRFDIPLRIEPIVLHLPDFSLRPIDSFAGNRSEQRFEPKSNLVKNLWHQFPTQQPWPTVHEALKFFKDEALRVFKNAPGNFMLTDKIFHENSYDFAVDRDQWRRWWARFLYERGISQDLAELLVQKEWDSLHQRINHTKELMYQREKRHLLERLKILENFERARDYRWKIQVEWFETQKWLIERGFKVKEDYRDVRMMNLYTMNDPSLVVRLPRYGKPLEEVLGKIHNAKILAIMNENLKWRFDTSYVTLPNGGISQTQSGGGKTKENVGARISWPVKEKRTEDFQTWHQTRFKIESPNGVPIQAPSSQGELPQKIAAKVHDPILEERIAHHRTFHRSGLLVVLPNDSMTPSIQLGRSPEKVTADVSWPHKEKAKILTKIWKDGDLFVRQGDQAFISQPHTGRSLEEVVGSIAHSHQIKRDTAWNEELQNSDFGKTPNGGFAPLRQSGDRPEKVTGEQANQMAHLRSVAHNQWLLTGKNAAPPRQGSENLKIIDFLPLNALSMKQERPPEAPPEFYEMADKRLDHLDTRGREPNGQTALSSIDRSAQTLGDKIVDHSEDKFLSQERTALLPPNPLPPDAPSNDQELKAPVPRQKAIKAFQSAMERDASSSMGRLQSHVHMLNASPLKDPQEQLAQAPTSPKTRLKGTF